MLNRETCFGSDQWRPGGQQRLPVVLAHGERETRSSAFRIWILTATFSHSSWFFTLFTNTTRHNWLVWPIADATPETLGGQRKGSKIHTCGRQHKARQRELSNWERERERSFMEISRRDYSNTVIKEETLFFKLSGWLMIESKFHSNAVV